MNKKLTLIARKTSDGYSGNIKGKVTELKKETLQQLYDSISHVYQALPSQAGDSVTTISLDQSRFLNITLKCVETNTGYTGRISSIPFVESSGETLDAILEDSYNLIEVYKHACVSMNCEYDKMLDNDYKINEIKITR